MGGLFRLEWACPTPVSLPKSSGRLQWACTVAFHRGLRAHTCYPLVRGGCPRAGPRLPLCGFTCPRTYTTTKTHPDNQGLAEWTGTNTGTGAACRRFAAPRAELSPDTRVCTHKSLPSLPSPPCTQPTLAPLPRDPTG